MKIIKKKIIEKKKKNLKNKNDFVFAHACLQMDRQEYRKFINEDDAFFCDVS